MLVAPRGVVVLDEATASVDHRTDQRLQACVRDDLAASTRLIVAHRLDSLMDCDAVTPTLATAELISNNCALRLGKSEGGSGVELDRAAYRKAVAFWTANAPIK